MKPRSNVQVDSGLLVTRNESNCPIVGTKGNEPNDADICLFHDVEPAQASLESLLCMLS